MARGNDGAHQSQTFDEPVVAAGAVPADRVEPAELPRHPVLWRLVLAWIGLAAVIGWLSWGSFGGQAETDTDRTGWTVLILVPGVILAWGWTWRLGRWLLGSLRGARPAKVELLVAHLKWQGDPRRRLNVAPVAPMKGWAGALWLRVRTGGEVRYQRVAWNRRLVAFALATGGLEAAMPARARRCPGFRRMFLVDIPGVGRLWPVSTARRMPPLNYDISPYDPPRIGEEYTTSYIAGGVRGKLTGGLAFLLLMYLMFALAGPVAAAYLPVLAVSFWVWQGGAPWGGVYSYVAPVPVGAADRGTGRGSPTGRGRTGRRKSRRTASTR